VQTSNYIKTKTLIKENCFKDDNILKDYLLRDGEMKPTFHNDKVVFPAVSELSVYKDIQRNPNNPALAYIDKYERTSSTARNDFSKTSHKLGLISRYWPEVLRVDDANIFATLSEDGKTYEVIKDAMRGGNISLEEAIINATNIFSDALEESNTKHNGLNEYLTLRLRCDEALEKLNKLSKTR